MNMKRAVWNDILTKMQRGVVYTCIGSTILGLALIGISGYRYTTTVQPIKKAKIKIESEELLSEGRETLAD